jgi:hypothetical protein
MVRVTWQQIKALKPCELKERRKLFTLKQRLLHRGITASEAFGLGANVYDVAWVIRRMRIPFDLTLIKLPKRSIRSSSLTLMADWYPEQTKGAIIAAFG